MRRGYLLPLAILLVGGTVPAFGLWTPNAPVQAAGGARITIPGDTYSPAVVVIQAGQSVTWVNKDSDKHTVVSGLGAPESFSIPADPGKTVSFTFTKPGIYAYHCQEHAVVDAKLHRAVARKDADTYPIAMEGLIVVKGPGLTGSPTASINISGGNYAPDIAVVAAGGKVTWTNADTDEHAVVIADGQKLALPVGKNQTATFPKPGVYLFYCERHATYNARIRRRSVA